MKIGIITVHRAFNYGSVLQCYALQEALKALGHDAWVIDYRQKWTEEVYKPLSPYCLWRNKRHPRVILRSLINYNKRKENYLKQVAAFSGFRQKFRLTEACTTENIPQGFDCYIVGSDQLWTHGCIGGEDPVYLGNFARPANSKLATYAMSCSAASLHKLGKDKLTQITECFDKLSIREQFGIDIIKEYTSVTATHCIDPTLLVDAQTWDSMVNREKWGNKKYVAIYQARGLKGQPNFLLNKAKEIADKNGWEVINLCNMDYTVEDFVSIIKYAQYVITTSFHATVFSIIMHTPLAAVKLNDGHDDRYVSLLQSVGAEDAIEETDFTPKVKKIDYNKIDEKLKTYRKKSLEFLKGL